MMWWRQLEPTYKALTALGSAFAAGFAVIVALLMTGAMSPPGVIENAENISQNREMILDGQRADERVLQEVQNVRRQGDRILCVLTLPEGTTPLEAERLCP
jgi:hypothetical protein